MPAPALSPVHARMLAALKPTLPPGFSSFTDEPRKLEVTNLVYRVETHSHIPFLTMFGNIAELRRRRVRFPGVRVVYGSSKNDLAETFMIYVRGRFVACGLRTEMSGIRALQMFRLDLQQCGIPIGLGMWTPVNVVVKVALGFPVDISAAHASRTLARASFEQKDFPGLIFMIGRVRVLVFLNGRMVLTGAGDCMEAERVYAEAVTLLRPFDSSNDENAPRTSKRTPDDGAAAKARRKRNTGAAGLEEKPAARVRAESGTVRARHKRHMQPAENVVSSESRVAAGGRKKGVRIKLSDRLIVEPNTTGVE